MSRKVRKFAEPPAAGKTAVPLQIAGDGQTLDSLLNGRLRVIQSERGYRFSLDALLLAHFADLKPADDLIDLGTGSGVLALICATRFGCRQVTGVDIQEGLVAMANRSVLINGLADSVSMRQADLRRPESVGLPQSFTAALMNPPYRRLHSGRMNPDPEKAIARHEVSGTADDFIAAAGFLLKLRGRLFAIYPASRMVGLLARMREGRIEPKRVRMVHSRVGGEAEFVLVEGVKGGREGLKVLPPLFVRAKTGGYTRQMAAIFNALCSSEVPGVG
jgi:tRNA1Val (adenine37-N6)-methyltransferase